MGKLTDPKWWTGRTDEQRARRAAARDGIRAARDDMRDATDDLRAKLEAEQHRHHDAEATRKAERAAVEAEVRAEGRERVQGVLDDREGRSLGGWGRRRAE